MLLYHWNLELSDIPKKKIVMGVKMRWRWVKNEKNTIWIWTRWITLFWAVHEAVRIPHVCVNFLSASIYSACRHLVPIMFLLCCIRFLSSRFLVNLHPCPFMVLHWVVLMFCIHFPSCYPSFCIHSWYSCSFIVQLNVRPCATHVLSWFLYVCINFRSYPFHLAVIFHSPTFFLEHSPSVLRAGRAFR